MLRCGRGFPITSKRPRRILIVDDDPGIRGLVRAVLRRDGYEVDEAPDGAEGLAALTRSSYDAVILDLMMPVVNGFQVIEQLEKTGSFPRCVIIMSAAAESTIQDIDSPVIHSKIRKPFDITALLNELRICADPEGSSEVSQPESGPGAP